jgi:hypothetical protein
MGREILASHIRDVHIDDPILVTVDEDFLPAFTEAMSTAIDKLELILELRDLTGARAIMEPSQESNG